MAQNRIQFQPAVSMPEGIARARAAAEVEVKLERARLWAGICCTCCGSALHGVTEIDVAAQVQPKASSPQRMPRASTLIAATNLMWTLWFLGIDQLVHRANDHWAPKLRRQPVRRYPTVHNVRDESFRDWCSDCRGCFKDVTVHARAIPMWAADRKPNDRSVLQSIGTPLGDLTNRGAVREHTSPYINQRSRNITS